MYLLFLGSLLYLGYRANLAFGIYAPGQIVNGTAYIVQSAIFLFMVYGILLAKQETMDESYEVFRTIYKGWRNKVFAKMIHITIIVLLFSGLHVLLLFVLFGFNNIPAPFYYSSFLYIVLYWVLPFMISGALGLFLGIVVKSKIVYPLMMIIGVFIGPLNQMVFIALTKMLPVWLQKLMFLINLGQSDPFRIYNIVYGSPLEGFRWNTKFYFLAMILIILVTTVFAIEKRKHFKLALIPASALVLLLGALSWNEMSPHLDELTSKQAISSDTKYYRDTKVAKYNAANTDFIVKSYDMDITVDNGLKNKVKMNLELGSTTNQLIFSLYHNFRVQSIRFHNEEIPFEQEADYLTVNFPGKLDPSIDYELAIDYEGYGPQRFFSNDQAIMMPGFFSWYPVPGNQPTAEFVNKTVFYTFNSQQPVQYTMKYTGPTPLFTNLDETSNHIWSGRSTSGITLVSGDMEEIQVNNKVDLVRPYTLYTMPKDLDKDVSSFIDLYGDIAQVLGQPRKDINKIFLLETRLGQSPVWVEDGYAILDVAVGNNNVFTLSDYLIQNIVEAAVQNYSWERQDKTMRELYTSSFSYWYGPKKYNMDKKDSFLIYQYSSIIDSYFPQNKSTFNKLVEFLDANHSNDEKIHSFFMSWLDSLRNKEYFGWDTLDTIISNNKE
ncbi:hypothetical protein K0T92_14895 [Paenibacillus oenotherae]|uniref:Uncharacterized protein n=1 Tax=Paenibacillus oenotherae TaxID=1435645 RepID=A0ABS7D8X3_9BACL|nr:hypothetical protein [Paenibacillus oenotherae]MBW7476031.1 hypothetical protein [Paenibacillus oenotherae]